MTEKPNDNLIQHRIETDYADAQKIADQNDRYEQLQNDYLLNQEIAFDFRSVVERALVIEQGELLADLASRDYDIYEELINRHNLLLGKRQELINALQVANEMTGKQVELLNKIATRATELAPQTENEINNLLESVISTKEEVDCEDMLDELNRVNNEITDLESVIAEAGRPWPVPKISHTIESDMNAELTEIIFQDEIPVEPGTIESRKKDAVIIERHGLTYGASIMLASALMNNVDRTFLPLELGDMIYKDETHFVGMNSEERERCIIQRIHRLLNKNDSLVVKFLAEHGYLLQYGYRHFINRLSGEEVQRKRRIYRVVINDGTLDTDLDFTEIVDSNSTDNLPAIIPRQELRTDLESELEQTSKAEFANEANKKVVELVNPIIDALYSRGLLPKDIDDKVSVRTIRNILKGRGYIRFRIQKAPLPIQCLRREIHRINENEVVTSLDILRASLLDIVKGLSQDKEEEFNSTVESILQAYYDTLND